MALNQAILALLIDNPCSGYDLAKDFSRSINFFWKASHQQIYRELAKLEDQGFIRAEEIAQKGRPDKKLYHITEAGKNHLAQWLLEPSEVMPIKEELLVKLWAAQLMPIADLLQEIQRHRQMHVEKLATYHQLEREFHSSSSQLPLADKYQYLVLRRGIRYEQDYIEWCDEVLEVLSNDSQSKPV